MLGILKQLKRELACLQKARKIVRRFPAAKGVELDTAITCLYAEIQATRRDFLKELLILHGWEQGIDTGQDGLKSILYDLQHLY